MDNIYYYQLMDVDLEVGFKLVEDIFKKIGMDFNDYFFWYCIYIEVGYEEEIKVEIWEKFIYVIYMY